MSANMISNCKTMIRSGGNKSALVGRPAATKLAKCFSLAELQVVKGLADAIGVEKVQQLSELLAK